MDPGAFVRSIGGGVGHLVGGAIGAIVDGMGTIVRAGEHVLPEPWFAIAVVATVGLFATWLVRK
ncbi:MAG TPA: hypothetical protein VKR30_03685 [Candidatus Limnocylindrales bacterium]|nr:hypothetical protein [Candidatus Limnocylindrales bacterium]